MTNPELEFKALLRLDLMSFVERCFMELQPTQQLSYAPHLEVMAAKLANTLLGRGPRRLIINLPPRSLKSITVSVGAVAWLLGQDPSKQIICASYGQELAEKLARDTRTIMASSFYRNVFPASILSTTKLSVNDFYTIRQGFRMATSIGGVLTGRGADIIIIDDPLKPDEALSETRRGAVNDWYDNTLLSRLNSKENGIIVIVMQRLHQDDLVGHVLERGEDWEILSFPAIAEEDECYIIETPIGTRTFRRKRGDVLDPGRESLHTLQGIKQLIGTYNFTSQYQQNPTPVGGAMVLTDWLRYYDPAAPLPRFTTVIQSWDTANKSGELNDYSVCTTWGLFDGKCYLLHVLRQRLNYPDLKRRVVEQIARYDPRHVVIEDKASGIQLIQDLKSEGVYQVKPYEAPRQADKIMRLHAQTAHFESGHVLLPRSAPWLAEYVRELTTFPGTRFDDQVDSTSQALEFLGAEASSLAVWEALGRLCRPRGYETW
jgi:predicted phage terminase large subunit-like protein